MAKYVDQGSLYNHEFNSENFHFTLVEYDGNEDLISKGGQSEPYISINYCLDGRTEAKVNRNLDYTFLKDEASMIFLPESEFQVTFKKNNPIKIAKFYFDRSALLRYSRLFETSLPVLAKSIEKSIPFTKDKSRQLIQREKEIIRDMACCPFHGDVKTHYMEAKMIELWCYYAYSFESDSLMRNGIKLKPDDYKKIRELRDFLKVNYREKLTLSGLAKRFLTNEFKIKTGFKELYNTSVFQYINDLKMDEAKWLLLEGNSCSDVANKLGYSFSNYFSTRFKDRFGISPRQFLSNHNLDPD